ncbi:hypothetical protein [Nocardia sp. NPDC057455]|uniref:hypothetical protein n=1 Tax=Nocardia sp. NPDC057455 TaxID=3346138 RepID=UPI00367259A1
MVIFLLYALFHLVLLSSAVLFITYCFRVVLEPHDSMESVLRGCMLIAGGLVVLATHVAGLTVAELAVSALSNATPLALIAGAVLPAIAGAAVGWYFVHVFPKSEDIAKRITIFIGAIAIIEFLLVYAQAIRTEGLAMGTAVIPNVAFVVGIIIYIGITYTHHPDRTDGRPDNHSDRRFVR